MSFKKLLSSCVSVLSTYNPALQDPELYLKQLLSEKPWKEDDDIEFVAEVFSGCVRHSAAIEAVTKLYSHSKDERTIEQDRILFRVVTYLLLFRLDELGLPQFRRLAFSFNKPKTISFFKCILDESNIKTVVFPEWCKKYEHSYVQLNLLSPLLRWLPELMDMLESLSSKANVSKKSKHSKNTTDMQPFNLTKPRPRSVPMPEKIPKLKSTNPVPQTTYKPPKEVDILSKARQQNRNAAEKRLIDACGQQFSCANAEISDKTKTKMAQYIKDENAKLNFDRPRARPLPRSPIKSAPIRLNAAAILREGILAQKKEEETEQKLMDYMYGGRDASEFLKWQDSMKQKDLQEQLADIERRRLEGKLSYEEAIYARQMLIKTNKQTVKEMKRETEGLMQQYVNEKIEREKEMRNLIEQIMADHENTKEAKRKLQSYKRGIVQSVNEESRALMQHALEQAEEEMRQKVSLIAKIRAIESVPIIRFKRFDITESSGAGLLGEMSVAELRERLSLLKAAEREEEEKKRDEIFQQKSHKDQLLLDTLEAIAKDRAERTSTCSKRSLTKSSISATTLQQDERIIELEKKLEQRRMERKQNHVTMETVLANQKRRDRSKKSEGSTGLYSKGMEPRKGKRANHSATPNSTTNQITAR